MVRHRLRSFGVHRDCFVRLLHNLFFTPHARLQKQRTELKGMKEKPDFSSEGFRARISAGMFVFSARNLRVDVINVSIGAYCRITTVSLRD